MTSKYQRDFKKSIQQKKEYSAFLRAYENYALSVLNPYQLEVEAFFKQWQLPVMWKAYAGKGQPIPMPIYKVNSRVKRPESVLDKIHRNKDNLFEDGLSPKSYYKMYDTVGVRILTYFLSDLNYVNREIFNHPDVEVCEADRPVAYMSQEEATKLSLGKLSLQPKESGYNSIHYTLRLKKSNIPLSKRPFFELQLRTVNQNTWAELEHYLAYKPQHVMDDSIKEQFKLISQSMAIIDRHFDLLKEKLHKAQSVENDLDDDALNTRNVARLIGKFGFYCPQRELNGMLKLLYSRNIETVGEFRKLATGKTIQLIKKIYHNRCFTMPTSFEVIAHLANLKGIDKGQYKNRVMDWMEFSVVTKNIRSQKRK